MYKGGLSSWRERCVKTYVEAHATTLLNVEEINSLVGLSKSYFNNSFKTTFGFTPWNYIDRQRVKIACRLLEDTNEPLAQIARACGYADQPHFTKRFRKVTGTTPFKYRMENQYERTAHA